MSSRPYQQIERRKSRQIRVGKVLVGGDAPISVQTMTNTLTSDAEATIAQIRLSEVAGVDIVRVSCPDEDSTKALAEIDRHRLAYFEAVMVANGVPRAQAPARPAIA